MKPKFWIWHLAWRNLFRNRRRNLFMGIAIAAAYGGILLFAGYVVWVEKYLRSNTVYLNQSGHITIARQDGFESQLTKPQGNLLTRKEQESILAVLHEQPEIAHIGMSLKSFVLAVQDCQSRGVVAIGRDEDTDQWILGLPETKRWMSELMHPEIPGNRQKLKAEQANELALVPTPPLLRRLKNANEESCASTSNPMQIIGKTYDGYTSVLEGKIIGEQSTGLALLDDRSLFMSTHDLQKLLETDQVGSIAVYARHLTDVPLLYWKLHKALGSMQPALDVMPFVSESVGLYYVGSIGFLGAVAAFFVLLVTAIVCLTLLSLFTITLGERSLEMGVLLAMGFPKTHLSKLIEAEALLLTIGSLGFGFCLSYGLSIMIYAQNIRFSPPGIAGVTRFTIAWEPWVVLVIAACFVAASAFSVRYLTHWKLKRSALSLLQSSTTL